MISTIPIQTYPWQNVFQAALQRDGGFGEAYSSIDDVYKALPGAANTSSSKFGLGRGLFAALVDSPVDAMRLPHGAYPERALVGGIVGVKTIASLARLFESTLVSGDTGARRFVRRLAFDSLAFDHQEPSRL